MSAGSKHRAHRAGGWTQGRFVGRAARHCGMPDDDAVRFTDGIRRSQPPRALVARRGARAALCAGTRRGRGQSDAPCRDRAPLRRNRSPRRRQRPTGWWSSARSQPTGPSHWRAKPASVVCAVRNSNHTGMLATHVLRAANEGMIGYFTSKRSRRSWHRTGGREPRMGKCAVRLRHPADGPASRSSWTWHPRRSPAARSRMHADRGEPIPEGWAIDERGVPTSDAAAAMRGLDGADGRFTRATASLS